MAPENGVPILLEIFIFHFTRFQIFRSCALEMVNSSRSFANEAFDKRLDEACRSCEMK